MFKARCTDTYLRRGWELGEDAVGNSAGYFSKESTAVGNWVSTSEYIWGSRSCGRSLCWEWKWCHVLCWQHVAFPRGPTVSPRLLWSDREDPWLCDALRGLPLHCAFSLLPLDVSFNWLLLGFCLTSVPGYRKWFAKSKCKLISVCLSFVWYFLLWQPVFQNWDGDRVFHYLMLFYSTRYKCLY